MTAVELAIIAALAASSPATHVNGDALAYSALVEADKTWVSWGLPPAGPAELRVYDRPPGDTAAARAAAGDNTVYITRTYRDRVWSEANDRQRSKRRRIGGLAQFYAVLTHERGHNLGLGHESTGIMQANNPPSPARGFVWAANWLKSRRLQITRRHATMERNLMARAMTMRGSENGNRYSPTGREVLTGVTRRLIDVTNPRPEDIDIRDIAQSLARQERFTGHCPLRPSVAAHSLAVEYIARQLLDAGGEACPNADPWALDALRAALMHDAPEFLVSDLNGAVKQDIRPKLVGVAARASAALRGRSRFDLLEDKAEAAIAARFGYDSEAHDALIHEADVLACAYEMAYDNWAPEAEPPAWMLDDDELLEIYLPQPRKYGAAADELTAVRFLARAAELGIT